MAESLDDGEFWLLPKFLTEDDVLTDMSSNPNNKKDAFDSEAEATNKALFPFEFSYGFGSFGHSSSDLSSPVESVMSSTEAESDEEDFMAGLTRQMAHSTLEEEDFARSHKTKGGFVTGSPQSTLCTVRSGCSRTQGSSRGSPNCQSQVSSPPGTWDLLYAAAGKVERIRMNQESYGGYNHNSGLLGPARKPSPVSVPPKNHNANPVDFCFYNSQYQHHHQNQQSLSHQKLQASQLHHLKNQQRLKQQQGSSVWGGSQSRDKATTGFYQVGLNRVNSTNSPRPLGLSPSAWPPLQLAQQPQQQNGSGMRAMFLGAPNGKRECTGTGVFLPRRVNTPTETRKKPACSTVLLPAKVVQALNLNFDELGSPFQPRFGSYAPDTGATVRYRNGYQKRILRQQQGANHEIRLPQEWTY